MQNAGLDEAQAGIKIAGININNLRYSDDTTLMAESEEELKSLLMKVKEESEKPVLKLNIWKTKILVHRDDPEGWDGVGGDAGGGAQDGEHMYTHDWFMSMYGKNHYNIVK